VYDTVLEETGDAEAFERTIGQVRVIESAALVISALAGGLIAQFAPLRATYFLTAPLLVLSALMLFRFREPQLHKTEEREPLSAQIRATYRTVLSGGHLRAIVALTVAAAILMQGMLEFGPLWLVALLVPPVLFGPHWAGLTSALGVGGLLGSRAWFTRDWTVRSLAVTVVACCAVLVVSDHAGLVVGVQVALTLLVVAVSIPVTRRLHDAVPSTIRAGVASGVGTLTWLAFVPFALGFGAISQAAGLDRGALLFVGVGVTAAALMLVVLPRVPPVVDEAEAAAAAEPDLAVQPAFSAGSGLPVDSPEALAQVRAAIVDMPAQFRQVIVLRDVQGRSPTEVSGALSLSPERQRELLHGARALVRERLERYFRRTEATP
jgi:hypothetical protein